VGQALYRAHRPKTLEEVVGQEHVTTALSRALKNGMISHAYLFTGPRGVGKTSIARILAHEINGLPYEDDATHLDIIEIDAASNRRIDEIRELRDKVHITPTSAKYKVYIIDEVHMLTKEAFNALLKTLEEPPAHVVFMLATTELHKLPETIISRTQRYALKPIGQTSVIKQLRKIADVEHIAISDEALTLVAAQGDGSMRDSTSLLDQVRNSGEKITLADVQAVLGVAPQELLEQLQDALANHDITAVAQTLQHIHVQGYQAVQVARQLGVLLRSNLLAGSLKVRADVTMPLLAKLIEIPASADPQSYLEVALMDVALSGGAAESKTPATQSAAPAAPKATSPKVMHQTVEAKAPVQVEPHPSSLRRHDTNKTPEPATEETPADPNTTATMDISLWPQVLGAIKHTHNTLFSIVNATKPQCTAGGVTLLCGFAFHQKRLNEPRNKKILQDVIEQVTGQALHIRCELQKGLKVTPVAAAPTLPPEDTEIVHQVGEGSVHPASPASAPPTPPNDTVAAISNIFGGGELLES